MTAGVRSVPTRSLWASRDFTVFWVVQTMSSVGNAFALVALPLLVLDATGSAAQMGLLTAIAGVGALCTGVFGGILVDRLDRRRLMIVCDLARVLLYGLVPVCWAWFGPQVWLLYVVMALAASFGMVFDISYIAAVANLVDSSQIMAANSRLGATEAIAYVCGPALAGMVSGLLGPTAAIGVDAATFGISALGLVFIRLRVTEGAPQWQGLRDGLFAGVVFLWRTPALRALTGLLTVVTFLSLGIVDTVIFYLRSGLGQGEEVVGYVLGLASVGTIAAAAFASFLRGRLGFGACWLGSLLLAAVAIALLGTSSSVPVAAAMGMVYSFGIGLGAVCSRSLRQQITPDHLLGRVTSAFWTLHSVFGPLGAALLTMAVDRVGAGVPLLVVGGVFLVVVLVGLFTPIRARHPEPARS